MEYICNTIEEARKALSEFKTGQGDIFICSDEVFEYLCHLKCCGRTPDLVFRPAIDILRHLPSLSIRCEFCRKEKIMEISNSFNYAADDPIFNESIRILKNKWNEDDQ